MRQTRASEGGRNWPPPRPCPWSPRFPIAIAKRRRGLAALDAIEDTSGDVGALLLRDGGQSRQRTAFLIERKRGIADDEDLRAAGEREVRSHLDEPFLVGLGAEPVGDGSGLHAGAPNDRSAGDPGSAGDDILFINVFDLGVRADIDAHFLELSLGEGRKIARMPGRT